jgi:hypothetical protein
VPLQSGLGSVGVIQWVVPSIPSNWPAEATPASVTGRAIVGAARHVVVTRRAAGTHGGRW